MPSIIYELFNVKEMADESLDRWKARFVVNGMNQVEGKDNNDTFRSIL